MPQRSSYRTHICGELNAGNVGETVTLSGWVRKRRDHGGLVFIDLWDRSGITQVALNPQIDESAHKLSHELRAEFVLKITGKVSHRPDGTVNKKLATGEIEIYADNAEIISRSETPPFVIDEDEEPGELLKLTHRYLEIRRGSLLKNLETRNNAVLAARNFLADENFMEIETPILTRSTPEGARDYLVPSRVQNGTFFALPQSPQLFKQILMVAGIDRYYQIARCFRDEDLRADRQPEFTQIDMELSFVDEDEILAVCEQMIADIFEKGTGKRPAIPFERISWQESMDRFGRDAPDMRFGMELADVSETAGKSEFKIFTSTLENGGTVRGLALPGGASYSRKDIENLTEEAKIHGAGGLAWIKVTEEGYASSIVKFFGEGQLDSIRESLGAKKGDLMIFVADKKKVAYDVLGALRVSIAKKLGLIEGKENKFVWVTQFPLVEYDEEQKRYTALHHPFTAPCEEDIDKLKSAPAEVKSRSYDLALNGTEIGGGSIRIHDTDLQKQIFSLLGIGEEEANEKFGFLLDALKFGAPPHGGIAFGLDRICAIMSGADSIRDVIAFPKTQKAQCPLTSAPAGVDKKQLRELGLKKAL